MLKEISEKPFKLISIAALVYTGFLIILTIFSDFSYKNSVYPFAKIIAYTVQGIAFLLFALNLLLKSKHYLYYVALEFLVFLNIYNGITYIALFLSSLLLVLLLTETKIISRKNVVIYCLIEVAKAALVIPYGTSVFLNYVGLTLFALCTICCVNLLFRHAYSNKDSLSINLDDYKLSDRQKNCIKEIVVNNTTIKALAIDYNISESAIKKDLAHIYKVLGINGKADLKALFIDYDFSIHNFTKNQ